MFSLRLIFFFKQYYTPGLAKSLDNKNLNGEKVNSENHNYENLNNKILDSENLIKS